MKNNVDAWRTLGTQWRLAFQIGAENRERGAPVVRLHTVWDDLRDLRRAPAHP